MAAADFDSDGLLDVYVANDGTRNFFYRNRGDGSFAETGLTAGAAYNGDGQAEAGMGIAVGDGDADGDADLLVTNFSRETNTLYRNEGGGRFADATEVAGLRGPSLLPLGFGAFFADVDNDADMDVFYRNNGDGTFSEWTKQTGLEGEKFYGMSALFGDYDDDGWPDLIVANDSTPNLLFRNLRDGRFAEESALAQRGGSGSARHCRRSGPDCGRAASIDDGIDGEGV